MIPTILTYNFPIVVDVQIENILELWSKY